jgi:hypothetical protein
MASNARFTEQAQPLAVGGDQLWKLTTEGATTFEIEAMGFSLPLNSKNGWSPFIK